jgi:hypothetical protein
VRRSLDQIAVRPADAAERPPLLVFLHGRGGGGAESNVKQEVNHHPDRFCAVGGHSAAVWVNGGESAPGAFDDAEDFARNDLIAQARMRRPAPRIWLDSGDRDPFLAAGRELAAALGVKLRTWRGEHNGDYWNSHYDEYMRFYARSLATC